MCELDNKIFEILLCCLRDGSFNFQEVITKNDQVQVKYNIVWNKYIAFFIIIFNNGRKVNYNRLLWRKKIY